MNGTRKRARITALGWWRLAPNGITATRRRASRVIESRFRGGRVNGAAIRWAAPGIARRWKGERRDSDTGRTRYGGCVPRSLAAGVAGLRGTTVPTESRRHHLTPARFCVTIPVRGDSPDRQKGRPDMATQEETLTVHRVAEIVEMLYTQTESTKAPRPVADALAAALGVADTCTGNPATAAASKEYAPKAGLSFRFYSVEPGYRTDTNTLIRCGYVAEWRGIEYRGEVVGVRGLVDSDGHSWAVRFYDATRYAATLPDGCRKLVCAAVSAAAASVPGLTVDSLTDEKENANRLGAVHSAVWAAYREIRNAAEIAAGGRYS